MKLAPSVLSADIGDLDSAVEIAETGAPRERLVVERVTDHRQAACDGTGGDRVEGDGHPVTQRAGGIGCGVDSRRISGSDRHTITSWS